MSDPHRECIDHAIEVFRSGYDTEIEAMEWPDHCCVWFTNHMCAAHHRGVWVHPTIGQFMAWAIKHELTGSV